MREAKASLSGKWGKAALATLIFMVLLGIVGFTYVGPLIVTGPLTFGYLLYLIKLSDNGTADINTLFDGFRTRFVETLIAGLLISILTGIGAILFIVPGIIVFLGLSMTYFIMIDDPNIGGVDAMKASWNLMNGHKWNLFCLYIRFIGWWILCCITFGILSFWIRPYNEVAVLKFYRNLRNGQAAAA